MIYRSALTCTVFVISVRYEAYQMMFTALLFPRDDDDDDGGNDIPCAVYKMLSVYIYDVINRH